MAANDGFVDPGFDDGFVDPYKIDNGFDEVGKRLIGGQEAVWSTVSDMASAIPRGLRTLGELAFSDADVPTALARSESTPSYEPHTERGKEFKATIGNEFDEVAQGMGTAFSHPEAELARMKPTGPNMRGEAAARSFGEALGNVWAPGVERLGGGRPRPTPEALEAARRAMEPSRVEPKFVDPDEYSPQPQQPPAYGRVSPDPLAEYGTPTPQAPNLSFDPSGRPMGGPETQSVRPGLTNEINNVNGPVRDSLIDQPQVMRGRGAPDPQANIQQLNTGLDRPTEGSFNFPQRPEVMNDVAMVKKVNDYKRWVEDAEREGNTALANELRGDFKSLMDSYGVAKDTYGRSGDLSLYDKTSGEKLPVERTPVHDRAAPEGWNPIASGEGPLRLGGKFAKQIEKGDSRPIEKGPEKGVNRGTFGQSGAIDYFTKGKVIPLEMRRQLAERQVDRLTQMLNQHKQSLEASRRDGDLRAQRDHLENIHAIRLSLEDATKGLNEFKSKMAKPLANISPLGGVGKKQGGAVKLPGGNWRRKTKDDLYEALARNIGSDEPIEMRPGFRSDNDIRHEWVQKAVNTYVNKYLGTSRDPLNNLTLPDGTRWEDATDAFVHSKTKQEMIQRRDDLLDVNKDTWDQYQKDSLHDDYHVDGLDKIPSEAPIWETSVTRVNNYKGRNEREEVYSYLEHVSDHISRIPIEQLKNMSFTDAVQATKRLDEQVTLAAEKKKADVAKRSMEGATVVKRYPDGSTWIKLDKPSQFAAESDMMGHSVRGYEPPKGLNTGRYLDAQGRVIEESRPNPNHPDWVPGAEGGHSNYGHGGWEAIKNGKAEVYSLRDSKGLAHVTIEVAMPHNLKDLALERAARPFAVIPDKPAITQIKGKGNTRPDAKYQEAITDFIKSKEWSEVRELHNTDLVFLKDKLDDLHATESIPDNVVKRAFALAKKMYGPEIKYITKQEWDAIVNPFKGPKNQQGAIKFFQKDPEFEKFKENLSPIYKDQAKTLWKALQAERTRGATPVSNSPQLAAVGAVPGLKNALKYIAPELGSWEDIKPRIIAEPDLKLGATGRGMTPGAALTGFWKQNTGVKYAGEIMNRAKVNAHARIQERLVGPEGLKSLIEKAKDAPKLWDTLVKHENVKDLTMSDLKAAGLSEEAVTAGLEIRRLLKDMSDLINKERAESKYGPLDYRPGFLHGEFSGDFQFLVRDKDGDLIGRFGRNTKVQAFKYARELQAKHPEWVVAPSDYRPLRGQNRADVVGTQKVINDLLVKDDPRIDAVNSALEELTQRQAFDYQGVKKAFMPKKKVAVEGAMGFEKDIKPSTNAQNGFQAQLQYLERGYQWLEMQRAGRDMRKLLNDEDIIKDKPELKKYLDLYWNTASGTGTMISKAVEDITSFAGKYTGLGETNIKNFDRGLKSALTISFLETLTFLGVQGWQPVQMMPHWMAALKQAGADGNVTLSGMLGNWDTAAYAGGMEMTAAGKAATKWIDDNNILSSHMLEDIRMETHQRVGETIRDAASWPLRKVEQYTRMTSFMGFTHFLESAGMERGEHLYETAMKITNMAMTDYRTHERPLMYQQLGALGELMSTLTAFKHNQYAQLFSMTKEGRGNGLATMVAMQAFVGGALGMYAIDELDSMIKAINKAGAVAGKDINLDTIRGMLLKHSPDWFTFGGMSMISKMDLSSRFSASNPIPDDISDAIFAYGSDIGKKLSTGFDAATSPSKASALKAFHQWSPNALKVVPEYLGTEKGQPAYNPATEKGKYNRDGFDWVARAAGGRSLKESKDAMESNEFRIREENVKMVKQSLVEKASREPKDSDKYLSQYMKLGGTDQEFVQAIEEYQFNKFTTDKQRREGYNYKNLNEILKGQRAREYK